MTYLYDGSGRQIGRVDGNYLYDGSGRQFGRFDGFQRSKVILFCYFFDWKDWRGEHLALSVDQPQPGSAIDLF